MEGVDLAELHLLAELLQQQVHIVGVLADKALQIRPPHVGLHIVGVAPILHVQAEHDGVMDRRLEQVAVVLQGGETSTDQRSDWFDRGFKYLQ